MIILKELSTVIVDKGVMLAVGCDGNASRSLVTKNSRVLRHGPVPVIGFYKRSPHPIAARVIIHRHRISSGPIRRDITTRPKCDGYQL